MGIKALQVGKTFQHISQYDIRPKEGEDGHEDYRPTRWNLRVLDSRLLGLLKDKSTKITIDPSKPDEEIGTVVNQMAYYFEVASLGLDKPDDFLDEKGEPVKWDTMKRNIGGKSYEVVTPDTLGRIPDFVIQELADKIISGNDVTVAEGNGSAGQS